MNLLIITSFLPYPLNSGGNVAQYEMIMNLRKKLNITIIFPINPDKESDINTLQNLWSDVKLIPFYIKKEKKKSSFITFFDNYFHRIKQKIRRIKLDNQQEFDRVIRRKLTLYTTNLEDIHHEFADFVIQHLTIFDYHIVQVEFVENLFLINYLPDNIHKIFIHHEIRYIRMMRELATLKGQTIEETQLIDYQKNIEIKLLQKFNKIIVLSEDDKQYLAENISIEKLEISPFSMKKEKFLDNQKFNNRLVFLGGEEHFPNKDGVFWFLENVWLKIHENLPQLQFCIIGNWSEDTMIRYKKYPQVIFTGFIDDLSAYLSGAMMIVPIRIGSGIRIKILEAISLGIPIISTKIGAEGIPIISSQDCYIADSSQQMYEAIKKSVGDYELCLKMAKNAYEKINQRYSIEACIETRLNIYQKIFSSIDL